MHPALRLVRRQHKYVKCVLCLSGSFQSNREDESRIQIFTPTKELRERQEGDRCTVGVGSKGFQGFSKWEAGASQHLDSCDTKTPGDIEDIFPLSSISFQALFTRLLTV